MPRLGESKNHYMHIEIAMWVGRQSFLHRAHGYQHPQSHIRAPLDFDALDLPLRRLVVGLPGREPAGV